MNTFQSITVTVAAGAAEVLQVTGTGWYCRAATASFQLAMSRTGEAVGTVEQGTGLVKISFDVIRIVNPNAGALTVTLDIFDGEIVDSRASFIGTIANAPVKSATLRTVDDTTLAADTATAVVAADTARRAVLITNKTGAALRVGDSAITMTRGAEVPAGASIEVETAAAVYCRSLAGGDVSLLEVLD